MEEKPGKPSPSEQKLSRQQKPDTSSVSEKLTPSEIEQLRQNKKESNAFFQKAFAHLRAKKPASE